MNLPKTPNPEKWINDVAVSKKDFMNNKIGTKDLNEFCKENGLPEPKYRFENGVAINQKTGEKIEL